MGEEILHVGLDELLRTVRLKRPDGTVIEAAGALATIKCCPEASPETYVSEAMQRFFKLADQLTEESFPVQIEFAVKSK